LDEEGCKEVGVGGKSKEERAKSKEQRAKKKEFEI
jgi:hypothetical protein